MPDARSIYEDAWRFARRWYYSNTLFDYLILMKIFNRHYAAHNAWQSFIAREEFENENS